MISDLKRYINNLIDKDELWRFYKTDDWLMLKNSILNEHHHECAICKSKGKITRYDIDKQGRKKLISTVHHVMEVRDYPEMALSRYYYDSKGEQHDQLIPICKSCHNIIHKKGFKSARERHYRNKERW